MPRGYKADGSYAGKVFKKGETHPFRGGESGWFKKGHTVPQEWREKTRKVMLGRISPVRGKNMVHNGSFKKGHQINLGRFTEKESWSWKGDDVKYRALHAWVYKKLGRPETCEECGKTGLKRQQIHWANKTGQYLRDVEDWIRLCSSCHALYDSKNDVWIPERLKY